MDFYPKNVKLSEFTVFWFYFILFFVKFWHNRSLEDVEELEQHASACLAGEAKLEANCIEYER